MKKRTAFGISTLLLIIGCGMPQPVTFTPVSQPAAGALARKKPRTFSADYYKSVEGLQGKALVDGLHQIIYKHTDLGYDRARDVMFATVDDPNDNNVITSIYIGRTVSGISNRRTAYDKGFNTEHVWPQSMGASGWGAKADLHHLFPADINVNSGRSNFPFGKVASVMKLFPDMAGLKQDPKLGADLKGRTVFEPPDRKKGDIARALLYFFTCYKRPLTLNGPSSFANFDVERDVLMAWHKLDPVDDGERIRNDAVHQAQGNRNPYIDRPEFVDRIAGLIGP